MPFLSFHIHEMCQKTCPLQLAPKPMIPPLGVSAADCSVWHTVPPTCNDWSLAYSTIKRLYVQERWKLRQVIAVYGCGAWLQSNVSVEPLARGRTALILTMLG